ncbi:MAG: right-handed parallel beta-helix repeat-containing protein [Chloroflexota bacterium]
MRSSIRRSIALSLVAVAALGAIAAPASAAAKTRYVAPKGSGGGSCATPDKHSIAAAIKASRAGDTILVCPGTYKGAFTVSKARLTIKATKTGKAKVTLAANATGDVVHIDAASATVQGLRIQAPTTGCGAAVVALISVTPSGAGARILSNTLEPAGTDTIGACGYAIGILANGSPVEIRRNTIRDFTQSGVVFYGGTVADNKIQYRHAAEEALDAATGTGIEADTTAPVTITGNEVIGLASRLHAAGPTAGATPVLNVGIALVDNGASGSVVSNNIVQYAEQDGIFLFHGSDATIHANTIKDVRTDGIRGTGGSGFTISDNVISNSGFGPSGIGIQLNSFAGSSILRNDARAGAAIDCSDDSTGVGSEGTDNTWTDDLGLTDEPDGICSPT